MNDAQTKKPKVIPEGYTSVTPWIISLSSERLIEFMKTAFNAEEIQNSRVYNEDGSIGHVEVRIGNAVVMLFDAKKDWLPTPSLLRLYVEDGDKVFQKSVEAGAKPITQMTKLFFGDNVGRVKDPFGNIRWIQERVEEFKYENFQELISKATAPEALEAMKYVQSTLDEEMRKEPIAK